MTAQLRIDFDEGARRRDVGHADALTHAVVEDVLFEIVTTVRTSPTLTATSDDVLDALPAATRASLAAFPSALGACFRKLALDGKIVDTGRMVRFSVGTAHGVFTETRGSGDSWEDAFRAAKVVL